MWTRAVHVDLLMGRRCVDCRTEEGGHLLPVLEPWDHSVPPLQLAEVESRTGQSVCLGASKSFALIKCLA